MAITYRQTTMSLASALGQLRKAIGPLPTRVENRVGQFIPTFVTVGDTTKEELVALAKEHFHQMHGYGEGCDFLKEFLDSLTVSETKREVELAWIKSYSRHDDWYWIWGSQVNHTAEEEGLEMATPEIVCKTFLAWRQQMPKDKIGRIHVSCGKLICRMYAEPPRGDYRRDEDGFAQPVGECVCRVSVGNDHYKMSSHEEYVIYVRPAKDLAAT